MQVPGPAPTPALPVCSMISARAMEELATGLGLSARFVCAGCFGNSSRSRKKEEFGGVYVRRVLPQHTHLIRLVQVPQVQILNEVLHDAHIIALSCKMEGIHSILKRAGQRR